MALEERNIARHYARYAPFARLADHPAVTQIARYRIGIKDKSILAFLAVDRVKHRIRAVVRLAVKDKILTPQACETCKTANTRHGRFPTVVAHHDDYNRPLSVRWLCNKCHRVWHAQNTALQPKDDLLMFTRKELYSLGVSHLQHQKANRKRKG